MLPKQRLQSKEPLSQKSVVVILEPAVEELSEPVEGARLSELDDDDVVSLESDSEEEQLSIPDLLSPGM